MCKVNSATLGCTFIRVFSLNSKLKKKNSRKKFPFEGRYHDFKASKKYLN